MVKVIWKFLNTPIRVSNTGHVILIPFKKGEYVFYPKLKTENPIMSQISILVLLSFILNFIW